MAPLMLRDVEYRHAETVMQGLFCAPEGASALPCVVLFCDAYGLTEDVVQTARRLSTLGLAVFAADTWGNRLAPSGPAEFGPLMGAMVADRPQWLARVAAAHDTAAAQPEVDPTALVSMGYCFGGSSALEHLRTGGDVRAVISVHGGLDLLAPDWSAASADAHVLLCTGSDDPMATPEQRAALQAELSAAGIDWQVDLYSDTKHAFTQPRSANSPSNAVGYHPRSAARAWDAGVQFLTELFPQPNHPVAPLGPS